MLEFRPRHWARLLLRPAYRAAHEATLRRTRELDRLWAMPRFTPGTTDVLGGAPMEFVDAASFLWTRKEIHELRVYEFRASSDAPRIIDGGANIGMSVLYFKTLYPRARITAFEPDPLLLPVLERNLRAAGAADVQVEPFALWSGATTLAFASDGADGGRLAEGLDPAMAEVRTVRLRDYLGEPVDLLKLDIEGAEIEVLQDCADHLGAVERIYVEYHSFADRPQQLHALLRLLADAGFRVHVASISAPLQPFVDRPINSGFDLQLHVFAMRA